MNVNYEATCRFLSRFSPIDLALGYMRYEALRKLTPFQFLKLHQRNLKGERFDDLVDELFTKI